MAKPRMGRRDETVARARPRGLKVGAEWPATTNAEPMRRVPGAESSLRDNEVAVDSLGVLAYSLVILALGVVSAWLYWRWLAQPYFLPRYVEQPLLDLGKIGGYDPDAGHRYTYPMIAIWVAYLVAWGLAGRVRGEWSLRALAFAGAVGCSAILLWLYPITAADIFNYVIYGIVQHRGANPLAVEPRDVIQQPLIGYSAWPFYPSPYGPIWQWISWAVTAITGERLLAGILGFKLVLIACHLLNTLLMDRIAAGTGLARPGVAALAYGWNPLLLYETAGNGHNDIVMLTGLLLALWLLIGRRREVLALPGVTLAVLAKYVAGLWGLVLLIAWLPAQWRERRWRPVVISGVICLGLVVVSFAPFWDGGKALEGVHRQSDLYTTSLTSWLVALLNERRLVVGRAVLLELIRRVAFLVLALTILVSRPRSGDWRSLVHALSDISLAYLLVGAFWFQPWYLVPLVGLSPLVNTWRRVIAIIYAFGATGSYVFYFYIWPALNWTPDRFVVQSWAVGIAHGPTWVALLAMGGYWVARRGGWLRVRESADA
jgi:hypothetical protein